MPNRRELLQVSAVAGAWSLASGAARAAAAASPDLLPIYKVVVDARYAESVRFGNRAAALGLATATIEGDMTRVWYDDIYHEWRSHPIAIAGLTEHGPLFCFEHLGRDCGLRVLFRAQHAAAMSGVLAHELTGPAPMLDACSALGSAGSNWPDLVAAAIARCPARPGGRESYTSSIRQGVSADTVSSRPLYSWVIAPAASANP
jgi:hypothetical protein